MTKEAIAERPDQTEELAKNPIAIGDRGLELKSMNDLWRFSTAAASSGLAPGSMNNNPRTIMLALQAGMELGLSPMESLKGIYVVNNRPTVWGDAALAIVRRSGLLEDFEEKIVEEDGGKAGYCMVHRRGDKRPTVRIFSEADAKAAGLLNKSGPWQTYRKRMLMMRARSWAIRDTFPDLLGGFSLYEETRDIPSRAQIADDDITDVDSRPATRSEGLAGKLLQQKPEPDEGPNGFLDADVADMETWDASRLNKAEASQLHKDLAQIGVASHEHSDFASEVLERAVDSLTDLTHVEAALVLSRANGVPKETEVA